MKFYKNSFKYMILSFVSIFLGCFSVPIASQVIGENDDVITQFKNTRQNYSVQLSSFVIPSGESGPKTAEDELDRLIKLANTKRYNLRSHPLFSFKLKHNNWVYCAVGSFNNEQAAQLLVNYINETMFPKEKAIILIPNPNILDLRLEFVVFRPKSS
ncbi:hypothetical protein Cva_00097 [Caedimonas varicaedens]|uniref:SPOR domain-containing protein n=1 Tax=Caedimonas varicaedens TaxID=1629334 RepID=A0A0K8MAF3_9PROT|nr:hypothetical protein Cva_00097 [Caedimonas varicaedens]